jgi:predicted RNA binding protein YcfA (HicA-like mRNA interferase family)
MSKLPRDLSGKEVVKALQKAGFYLKRQKGSHIVLRRDDPFAQVVVPDHTAIDTGTLAGILHGARLSVVDLLRLISLPMAKVPNACGDLPYVTAGASDPPHQSCHSCASMLLSFSRLLPRESHHHHCWRSQHIHPEISSHCGHNT